MPWCQSLSNDSSVEHLVVLTLWHRTGHNVSHNFIIPLQGSTLVDQAVCWLVCVKVFGSTCSQASQLLIDGTCSYCNFHVCCTRFKQKENCPKKTFKQIWQTSWQLSSGRRAYRWSQNVEVIEGTSSDNVIVLDFHLKYSGWYSSMVLYSPWKTFK